MERIKTIIWNIPLIGVIYLTIAVFYRKLWFENISTKNIKYVFLGLIIQLVALPTMTIILKKFFL